MKRLILTLLICVCSLGAKAQDMAAVFTSMPDQYIPQLENAWRKDLIDLYTSGKEARLKNTMNGYSSLLKLTNDYALLQTTESSTVEMKLLPLVNNTFVVCMVSTVDGPVSDSHVEFFTTDWQPLEAEDLFIPASNDWYFKKGVNENSESFLEATSLLDLDLFEYNLSPDSLTLTATYTTPQYLSKEDQEKVAPYLSEPLVYKWEKSHFIATAGPRN